ncbi:gamma-tubulin complex component protein [Umbelopsis sp. AD052]|nr:gamma-tubulin complex component protein [Umbelopsis sp. AD052]
MDESAPSKPPTTDNETDISWDDVAYSLDETLDPSIRQLVEKLLPIATYYMSVDAFVELHSRFEFGTVSHALCSAIRSLLKEYLILIAQLEHQFRSAPTFTLQKLWFYVQPTLQTMHTLHTLANGIRAAGIQRKSSDDDENDFEAVLEGLKGIEADKNDIQVSDHRKGGALLTMLAERLVGMSGDPKNKKLYSYLLSQASLPYLEILYAWIHRGEIQDPYNEFMVQEKKNVRKENLKEDFNDAYWEMRYTIREVAVPSFLEPLKHKILVAGKYLNVVRECGITILGPHDTNQDEVDSEELPTPSPPRPREVSADTQSSEGNKENVPFISSERSSELGQKLSPSVDGISMRGDILMAIDGGRFVQDLEAAYKYANRTLLDLLLKDQQLLARLRSLKRYFFLDQSDFLAPFLDVAKEELRKPTKDIVITRLQSLLDLTLRNPSSVAVYDPYKEDVKVGMSSLKMVDQLLRIINVAGLDGSAAQLAAGGKDGRWIGNATAGLRDSLQTIGDLATSLYGLHGTHSEKLYSDSGSTASSVVGSSNSREVLNGFNALTLDYTVTFPLSLIISRKALTKYQLIFRHHLYLRHTESLLSEAWTEHKMPLWKRPSKHSDINGWKYRIFALRNRMTVFVQQFSYYITNEILEPNHNQLKDALSKVSTVDQVLQIHSDFLDSCLKECMLTNSKLLRIYSKLMTTCVLFANYTDKFTHALTVLEKQYSSEKFGVGSGKFGNTSGITLESQSRSLHKIEENFSYHMKLLIDALNYYSATETLQFLCLVVRLDYNSYYGKDQNKERSRYEGERL